MRHPALHVLRCAGNRRVVALVLFACLSANTPASAAPAPGQAATPQPGAVAPAASVPGELAVDTTRMQVGATRLDQPLKVDGRLDDEVYTSIPSVGGFVQQEPRQGEPATEGTELWVLFDDQNLYIAARLIDSQPEHMVATEMRRDNFGIDQGDNVAVVLDTFNDGRNAVFFQTNPAGALRDGLITDEANLNTDWNTAWDARVTRSTNGWAMEMAIPFRSLRYRSGAAQVWGINVVRSVRWKNEKSFLSPVPASWSWRGIRKVSSAAGLVGLEPPTGGLNLEVKPYVLGGLRSVRQTVGLDTTQTGDIGADAKIGVTKGLTLDLTTRTDFAQVESDTQQVNLTRFSLFFPEKREFFLEGQGLFAFGGAGGDSSGFGPPSDAPVLFFSRRIGLQSGQAVPILGGGRLTGRAGRFTVGALNIQTADEPSAGAQATNFSVARVRRDILRRSAVGVIGTSRSRAANGLGSNQAFGVDGTFAFFQNLTITSFLARTWTEGRTGSQVSYNAKAENSGDRYGFEYEHGMVGADFNPEIGFVRRTDFRRHFGNLRFSPRPTSLAAVRKFTYAAEVDYFESLAGVVQSRKHEVQFGVELQNGDRWSSSFERSYEFLDRAFPIATGLTLPIGAYHFQGLRSSYELGQQRRLPGRLSLWRGSFYSGERTEVGYDGRVSLGGRLLLEPRVAINWVDLAEGAFTAKLVGSRATVVFSPRMFLGALVQYNSSTNTVDANVRFRWEYRPGSDFFVVYSEGRDTGLRAASNLQNRSVVVKATRLLRF